MATKEPNWTYADSLQSGNKQISHFGDLAEGEACNWTSSFMQGQSFAVTISGDIPFG